MAYADAEHVRQALAPVSDRRRGTAAMLEEPVIVEQLEQAAQQVDGALAAAGYATPLQGTVPALVRGVTVAIAAYLCDLIYRQGVAHEGVLDPVIQRYEWATRLLGAWAKGQQVPPGLDPDDSATGGDIAIGTGVNPYPGRLFCPDDMTLSGSPGGRTIDPLYDPDAWRYGEDRGWS